MKLVQLLVELVQLLFKLVQLLGQLVHWNWLVQKLYNVNSRWEVWERFHSTIFDFYRLLERIFFENHWYSLKKLEEFKLKTFLFIPSWVILTQIRISSIRHGFLLKWDFFVEHLNDNCCVIVDGRQSNRKGNSSQRSTFVSVISAYTSGKKKTNQQTNQINRWSAFNLLKAWLYCFLHNLITNNQSMC